MTGHDDFDRTLVGWFEADALSPGPADALDRVLDATRRRRPRPAWLADLGSHWVGGARDAGSSSDARSLPRLGLRWSTALVLLLIIAALVGGAILVGARLSHQSPLPPGRLGHLAYGLDGDIFVADWDGGNPIRIADGHANGRTSCQRFWGEGPIWSPDGRHLAYRSAWDDVCDGKVYISDPEGHVVASFPGTGWLVSWSPDSSRIATWADLDRIGVFGIDGVRQALLTLPPGQEMHGDYDPVWSPDGASLMIRLAARTWELPLDGRPSRPLPMDDRRTQWSVQISPDGAHVASVSSNSLFVASADGSGKQQLLINGGVSSAQWSPTGDRIAFGGTLPLSASSELRVVDVASGAVTFLATAPGADSAQMLSWSPEGDRILFSMRDTRDVVSLWSVDADGSDRQLLVPGSDWGDWQRLPATP